MARTPAAFCSFALGRLLLLALLAGAAQAQAVRAVDDEGRVIALTAPAQRVVSLAPHLTEQLFAIGAGSTIVATTEFADYPPAARSIARVARAHNVDLERVAAARPDLIAVWGSGYSPAVLEALKRLGVPVFISEPRKLDDIAASMQRLGELTGAPNAASAAARFRTALDALRAQYAGRAPVSVFYQIWSQPLMTLSGKHVISEAIRLCGGRNVFEDLAPLAPQVSTEAVLAANPQVIVTAEAGGRAGGALDPWRRWPQMDAVKHGRLVTLDADRINRHGPRMTDEIATLCRTLDEARGAAQLQQKTSGRP